MVTVKELIQILEKFPQDMEVVHTTGVDYEEMRTKDLPVLRTLCESSIYYGVYKDIRYADRTYNKYKISEKVCI